jgi:hypothetical protein
LANLATPGSTFDLLIGYTVTVVDSSDLITDIHLAFNAAVSGDAATNVTETAFDSSNNIIGQASVTNPPPKLQDDVLLSQPCRRLFVQKDILLFAHTTAGNPVRTASISFIDQLVFQTVIPEPASLLLLGSELIGLGALRRRGGSAVPAA